MTSYDDELLRKDGTRWPDGLVRQDLLIQDERGFLAPDTLPLGLKPRLNGRVS